jgi:hypothetical protein
MVVGRPKGRLWKARPIRLGAIASLVVTAVLWGAPVTAKAPASSNPCDLAKLPVCTSALGPLRDITAYWRVYQAALVQPIPIADYYPGDSEDNPVTGAGFCGTERYHPPPPEPKSTVETGLHGLPAPPRNVTGPTKYCFLRYLPTDFTPLCAGCHRVLIDYSAIPRSGPRPQGHWAGHIAIGSEFAPVMPVNGHSPNVKNLCSDKFFNPTPGSGCRDPLGSFDAHLHSIEGDTAFYHHYPFEGRYFNGPAYLAGDGGTVPYHWVIGAYFDIDPKGAVASPVYYGAGYRGAGDRLPDTDVSYGCLCEVPPAGHSTISRDFSLSPPAAARP